ncbi:MAG: hypothetical protein ACRCVT_00730 [Leadbetterella sp.]
MKKIVFISMLIGFTDSFGQNRITSSIISDTLCIERIVKYKSSQLIYAKNNLNNNYKIICKHLNNDQKPKVKKNTEYYFEISTLSFEINGEIVEFTPNRKMCRKYGKRLKICTEPENGINQLYDLIKIQVITK